MVDFKTIDEIREYIGVKLDVPKETVCIEVDTEIPSASCLYGGTCNVTIRVGKYFIIPEFDKQFSQSKEDTKA